MDMLKFVLAAAQLTVIAPIDEYFVGRTHRH
jgi:hypothetical protein